MKRRHAILLAGVAIASLDVLGCERALPTEPDRKSAEILEAAPQPSLNLAGRWDGTITFHPFAGNLEGLSCDGRVPVSVVLTQDETLLSGGFGTRCPGNLEIRGVIDGGGLSGSLDIVGGISLGRISGSVTPSRIVFSTRTTLGEDGLHKGEPPFLSSEVELHPQMSAPRERPILAGGPPSHRISANR